MKLFQDWLDGKEVELDGKLYTFPHGKALIRVKFKDAWAEVKEELERLDLRANGGD